MNSSRRAVAALVLSLVAALSVVGGASVLAPAAQAACPIDDPTCGTSYTETATRTLSVAVNLGTVTGGINGSGISCTSAAETTCSQTVHLSHTCDTVNGCPDWPTTSFTLTASGPDGYQTTWSPSCTTQTSTTCGGTLGDATTGDDTKSYQVTWNDVTPPVVTFNAPAKVGAGTSSLTASATDNSGSISRYDWRVDGLTSATHTNTLPLSGVPEGTHQVMVLAYDGAGNASSVFHEVTVDRTVSLQYTTIAPYTNAATVPLTFTTDPDVVSQRCQLDSEPPSDCTSGWSGVTSASPDGAYTYHLTLTDDVGNVAAQSATFTLDRTPPTLAVTGGPANGATIGTRTADFTVSTSDANPGTVVCSMDGSSVDCAEGTAHNADLADGDHTFSVVATDLAGNAVAVQRHFTVAADPFHPKVTAGWRVRGSSTTFRWITVTHLPISAKAVLRCSRSGSCPWKSRVIKHPNTTVAVLKGLGHPTLRKGAHLTLTLTSAAGQKQVTTWVVRARKAPRVTTS